MRTYNNIHIRGGKCHMYMAGQVSKHLFPTSWHSKSNLMNAYRDWSWCSRCLCSNFDSCECNSGELFLCFGHNSAPWGRTLTKIRGNSSYLPPGPCENLQDLPKPWKNQTFRTTLLNKSKEYQRLLNFERRVASNHIWMASYVSDGFSTSRGVRTPLWNGFQTSMFFCEGSCRGPPPPCVMVGNGLTAF